MQVVSGRLLAARRVQDPNRRLRPGLTGLSHHGRNLLDSLVALGGLLALVALALAAGCGSPEESLPAELVLGGAAYDGSGFVAAEDGADAELIPGAQGGFHVWLNMRVRGVAGQVYVERQARRVSDDTLVFRGIREVIEIPEDALNNWWQPDNAAPAFMCPSPIGIRVFDEPLRLTVELKDQDEALLAQDEWTVVPRCPDGELADFCLSICSG